MIVAGEITMLVELEPFAANLKNKKNIPRIMIIFKVKEEKPVYVMETTLLSLP